jgi:hypothetical protein
MPLSERSAKTLGKSFVRLMGASGGKVPAYLVKITTRSGLVKPPMVVNHENEQEVIKVLREKGDDGDVIEIKGVPPYAMRMAFGDIPEGSAVFRFDWIWSTDGDIPRPF